MNRGSLHVLILLLVLLMPIHGTMAAENDSKGGQEPLILLKKTPPGSALNAPVSPASPGVTGGSAAPLRTGDVQQELRDIYGPVAINEAVNFVLIGVIGALLAAIAALAHLFLKKKRGKTTPPIPPWEIALSDLSRARSLMTPENGLAYMDRAGNILRSYIETRFGIKSTRQTTTEFLHGLEVRNSVDLKPFKKELQLCLEQADMAKFAHHLSNVDSMLQMEEGITGFVNNTKPVPDEGGGMP